MEDLFPPRSLESITKILKEELELENIGKINLKRTRIVEAEEYHKDGSLIWVEINVSFVRDKNNKPTKIIAISRDITQHKQAEIMLKKSEKKYKTLLENVTDGIFVAQNGIMKFFNDAFIKLSGYSEYEMNGMLLEKLIHPDDRERVMDNHMKRMQGDPFLSKYKLKALTKNGSTIIANLNSVVIKWEGKPAILGFVNDITDRELAEKERQQAIEKLSKNLSSMITTISLIIEARDPYTAGHQRKVSGLATAIAEEMGLSKERTNIISMASAIHDIGKISVPAEILSKPSRITNLELMLIREHPQIGYHLLKEVDLPYPTAETVLQHHERLNGSGYPNSLRDDQIILEARIVSVADVVEAMSSHRPYRPELGIDIALEEINKNSGILYDKEVSATCTKLFKKKGFTFEKI